MKPSKWGWIPLTATLRQHYTLWAYWPVIVATGFDEGRTSWLSRLPQAAVAWGQAGVNGLAGAWLCREHAACHMILLSALANDGSESYRPIVTSIERDLSNNCVHVARKPAEHTDWLHSFGVWPQYSVFCGSVDNCYLKKIVSIITKQLFNSTIRQGSRVTAASGKIY